MVEQFDMGATWKLLICVHRIIESCELEWTFKVCLDSEYIFENTMIRRKIFPALEHSGE